MFIAEIGINHNGDINIAKEMIRKAKEAGADVVKFQKRNPDVCIPDSHKYRLKSTPWGEMTYLDYKKKLEFGKKEYDEIDKYCREIGIKWSASVWDIDSLYFLLQYNIPFIKLPSAMIMNVPLIRAISLTGIPVVASIGMSTEQEIIGPLSYLWGKCDLTILHCNSSYPSKDNELDLNVIPRLKGYLGDFKIGYSGHEEGFYPTIIAKVLGAEVIERHVTLDKNMWGTDQKASLTFEELEELIDALKKVPIWLGQDKIRCYPSERKSRQKLRRDIYV